MWKGSPHVGGGYWAQHAAHSNTYFSYSLVYKILCSTDNKLYAQKQVDIHLLVWLALGFGDGMSLSVMTDAQLNLVRICSRSYLRERGMRDGSTSQREEGRGYGTKTKAGQGLTKPASFYNGSQGEKVSSWLILCARTLLT